MHAPVSSRVKEEKHISSVILCVFTFQVVIEDIEDLDYERKDFTPKEVQIMKLPLPMPDKLIYLKAKVINLQTTC